MKMEGVEMKIIINADDFGFSESINNGIIDAYKEGLISSTTIMINMPYAEDAIFKYKSNSSLGLGLHVNLTQGSPLASDVKSLVDSNNIFHNHKRIENMEVDVSYDDVYKEIKMQIEKLLSYDVEIDHLDYHHNIHFNPCVRKVLIDLAREYDLPIRAVNDSFRRGANSLGVKTTDDFSFDFYGDGAKWQNIVDFVSSHKDCSSIEILTHCGYVDCDTKRRTSYILREVEINELRKLKSKGFYSEYKLSKYSDL